MKRWIVSKRWPEKNWREKRYEHHMDILKLKESLNELDFQEELENIEFNIIVLQ